MKKMNASLKPIYISFNIVLWVSKEGCIRQSVVETGSKIEKIFILIGENYLVIYE